MKGFRAAVLGSVATLALASAPAAASVDEYTVEGESSVRINLEVCSAESQLAVRGDTGTDLDFTVSNAGGTPLHTDQGVDDYLSYVIEKSGNQCETYSLDVSNLGEEANTFAVVLEPITESSTRIQKYIIQANQTQTVQFKACGTSAEVTVRGDGDTDLDFIIRNSDGATVHENDDLSDETNATLSGLLSDCETFDMEVANLGNVYNAYMVVIEPSGADEAPFAGTAPTTSLAEYTGTGNRNRVEADASGPGEYRVDARSALLVDFEVCGAKRLEVLGGGDTDLDFTVTNPAGDTVHSDFDLSDATYATLTPLGECETFKVEVDNLGEVHNDFTIALIDADEPRPVGGAGEYRVNANLGIKVPLRVCEVTQVRASGDGDTDLDFDVTDASGTSVHSNYDLTDATDFTLDPGDDCADFWMSVENLGDVYNLLTVAFGEEAVAASTAGKGPATSPLRGQGSVPARTVVTPPPGPDGEATRPTQGLSTPQPVIQGYAPDAISTDGNTRALALLNRTGEGIQAVYWSNSATLEWGENRLLDDQSFAHDQQWNVNFFDGSNACLFNLRAVTDSNRLIEYTWVNICNENLLVLE